MEQKLRPPFRTVLLIQDLDFGGTQRYAVQLLKHLDRTLFSPELWVLRGGADMLSVAEEANAKVVYLSLSSWVGARCLIHLLWRLVRHRPDILYTLMGVPNIWGRPLGALAGVPAIVTSWRGFVEKQLDSLLWPLSSRIVCNAEALREVMVRAHSVEPGRIAVVPNAVDSDFFSPANGGKASEPTVVYVGRLAQEKDLLTLLEGFRRTLERVPSSRLDIVGNGHQKPKLEDFINRASLATRVRLIPACSDIRPFLRRAWVFAMTSISEASPNAILEAMATGLPVMGTRVGGIPDLVQENTTGLLVEPSNPEAVCEALTRLLINEDERTSMGRKGRERVLAFHSVEKVVNETQRILVEAVEDAVRSRQSLSMKMDLCGRNVVARKVPPRIPPS